MGQPAARKGDMHNCPAYNGDTPHKGGPIIDGDFSVLIDDMPSARVGDKASCDAPPDTISSGSGTVFVSGKAAARKNDSTAHGGVIVAGSSTVEIG